DPVGKRFWPAAAGRDPARTPMPWSSVAGAGFTSATPWLRIGEHPRRNVAVPREDSSSALHFCRDPIALRRAHEAVRRGSSLALASPPTMLAWRRGERFVVAINLGDAPGALADVRGRVCLGTDRARDGEPASGSVSLRPWEGLLIETAP